MNDRPGTSPKSIPFAKRAIEYSSLPGQSKLFLDHTDRAAGVLPFYPSLTRDLREYAPAVLGQYRTDRSALCALLERQNRAWGADDATLRNIGRLRSGDSVAVMTGQQAGLFTGPAYTVYKAVSAIRLADKLTSEGLEAVPVFWVASEDHDIEEVSSCGIVSGDSTFRQIAYPAGDTGKAVSDVRFSPDIGKVTDSLAEALPESPEKEAVLALVRDCYRAGESFSDAFASMMTRLFAGRGLVLVSPMDAEFRALARPIAEEAVVSAERLRGALIERDSVLNSAGYHSQVKVAEDFFPFFLVGSDGTRTALKKSGGEIAAGGTSFTSGSLAAALREDPTILSPSALMRPVVQDYVFPNVCYFGGSAEIAYFAQNSAVYEALGRPVTPVRHRAAFTIIEPRNRRTLESYGLELEDLFKGREAVAESVAAKVLDPDTAGLFDRVAGELDRSLDELGRRLAASDPTLKGSLERRRPKLEWHISKLKTMFLRSEAFRDEVLQKRLDYLFGTVFPAGTLQERSVGFIHFLNLYGSRAIGWLFEAEPDEAARHTIITL